ncbi:hypothetical protein AXG93_242s1250 [Marchantia polymorpha subsp. ruderalis]|uniref:Uncharacterized protein n=1 Tax=Marchantia polymorpha subsp. ruderalis TaxID=1480154 RepID=A0A176VLX7_MARPO|nr:hypothetical protein AXG93_242s1250 [Marchantia polymorpha subsp. ruderalis]
MVDAGQRVNPLTLTSARPETEGSNSLTHLRRIRRKSGRMFPHFLENGSGPRSYGDEMSDDAEDSVDPKPEFEENCIWKFVKQLLLYIRLGKSSSRNSMTPSLFSGSVELLKPDSFGCKELVRASGQIGEKKILRGEVSDYG